MFGSGAGSAPWAVKASELAELTSSGTVWSQGIAGGAFVFSFSRSILWMVCWLPVGIVKAWVQVVAIKRKVRKNDMIEANLT